MARIATIITLVATIFASNNLVQAQAPVIKYKFGMNVRLDGKNTSAGYYTGLYIRTVTPGGAAYQAGLRPGMLIVSANDQRFSQANNDYQAVAILQRAVDFGGGGGGGGIETASAGKSVKLVVMLPCGTFKYFTCYPRGGGIDTLTN